MDIARGQRLKLADLGLASAPFRIEVDLPKGGLNIDVACFGLDASRRLSDERYMSFFNQPVTPCSGVRLDGNTFSVDLARLPASIEVLTLTLAIDGPGAMRSLGRGTLSLKSGGASTAAATVVVNGADYADERALMLLEIYRKDGAWRISYTGQGFNQGLDALIRHFGGTVADAPAPAAPASVAAPVAAPLPPPPVPSTSSVSLEKRVEREAPHLVSLVKKVGISLDKHGLAQHKAKVALCLDISGSMSNLYRSGQVKAFCDRILALAARFDDDGELDVFLFGTGVHQPEPMSLARSNGYIEQIQRRYPLEGGTNYGRAMDAIRRFYFPGSSAAQQRPHRAALPVYVMFLTDGQTTDEALAERQVRESSFEPLFWQFMGIGKSNKAPAQKKGFFARLFETDFAFLEKLDNMPGRHLDNANFFSVSKPDEYPDDALYDLLLSEYKGWLPQARQSGLLG
jgi:stress response protein SCP2